MEKSTVKKNRKTYYFSVEGQTEKLYLKHLENLINLDPGSRYEVIFDIIISRYPSKRINSLPRKEKNIVYHFCDFENNDSYNIKQFLQVIDGLCRAKKNDRIEDYKLAYSNQTFDLWLILHYQNSFAPNLDKKKYIKQINKAFGTKYRGMQEFKRKENLNKLFKKLTLQDVFAAIKREKQIMSRNAEIGYTLCEYRRYNYYRENPSLTVGTIIEEILQDCGLIDENLT